MEYAPPGAPTRYKAPPATRSVSGRDLYAQAGALSMEIDPRTGPERQQDEIDALAAQVNALSVALVAQRAENAALRARLDQWEATD